MKKMRLLLPILCLVFAVCVACEAAGVEAGVEAVEFRLNEPVEVEDKYNDHVMEFTWTKVKDAYSYEAAVYVEGEDSFGRGPFAIRSTKGFYDDSCTGRVTFLSGVYTDTAKYRIKVRPKFKGQVNVEKDAVWSNIWEIDFTDGKYTLKETDADFDEEIEAKKAEEKAAKEAAKQENGDEGNTAAKKEKKQPLPHEFPEPLLTYLAKEKGEEEPLDPEEIAFLTVSVNHCEYGEPAQSFSDEKTIGQFREALKGVTVTGKKDDIFSTETSVCYSAADRDRKGVLFIAIQNGLLEASDGRYALTGLGELSRIDGVKLADDWNEYWGEYNYRAREYEDSVDLTAGTLLDVASYGTHLMAEGGAECITYADVYIDWNSQVGKLRTQDPEEIKALFEALNELKPRNPVGSGKGQMWHITFDFVEPDNNFMSSAYLEFMGTRVKIGDYYYELEGMKKLYDAVDCEVLKYLRDYSETPILKPSY